MPRPRKPQHDPVAIERWLDDAIVLDAGALVPVPDGSNLAALDAKLARAPVVFLGETNHFVHEKVEFRLWWLSRLAAMRPLVVAEELSWFDGCLVADYLNDGDEAHLHRLVTFGYRSDARTDRNDEPTGVLKASAEAYPTAALEAEQIRFYRALRRLGGVRRYFGFDTYGHDAGYVRLPVLLGESAVADEVTKGLQRVPGESIEAEAARLERTLAHLPRDTRLAAARHAVEVMVDGLRYSALANRAPDYETLRPAMAFREDAMKRRLGHVMSELEPDDQLVLLGHAFHLAKHDAGIRGAGVGPGGGRVPSLGHHLVQERGVAPFVVWMLYGAGEDSQPFPDLPGAAVYPDDSLNGLLAARGTARVTGAPPPGEWGVGHMYNQVVPVDLAREADAVFFLPHVSPLHD